MHLVGFKEILASSKPSPILRNAISIVMANCTNVQPLEFSQDRTAILPVMPGMLSLLGVTLLAYGASPWAQCDPGLYAPAPIGTLGAQIRHGNAQGHGRLGLGASAHC